MSNSISQYVSDEIIRYLKERDDELIETKQVSMGRARIIYNLGYRQCVSCKDYVRVWFTPCVNKECYMCYCDSCKRDEVNEPYKRSLGYITCSEQCHLMRNTRTNIPN